MLLPRTIPNRQSMRFPQRNGLATPKTPDRGRDPHLVPIRFTLLARAAMADADRRHLAGLSGDASAGRVQS